MTKLTFILKQHTPVIHFQHDQDKATLRASEVKPRLDRYIIEKKGGWNKIPDEWKLTSEEGQPLKYKMRIEAKKKPQIWKIDKRNWGSFFGNQRPNEDKYQMIYYENGVCLEILAFSNDLKDYICKIICGFFNSHTFGARQSKGYGFFYPKPESPAFGNNAFYQNPASGYSFTIDALPADWSTEKKLQKVFYLIDLFYRSLRSGINLPRGNFERPESVPVEFQDRPIYRKNSDFYCKPALFQFLKSQDPPIQWDKRTIKEIFLNEEYIARQTSWKERTKQQGLPEMIFVEGLPKQIERYNSDILQSFRKSIAGKSQENETEDNVLWRDLFGLSTHQEWGFYGTTLTKTHNPDSKHKEPNESEGTEFKIERFQSPLRFFPVFSSENNEYCIVFFEATSIPLMYSQAKFKVKMDFITKQPVEEAEEDKQSEQNQDENDVGKIFKMGRLDLNEFIEWIIENKDILEKMVPKEKKSDKNFLDLQTIYSGLCKNNNS